jgi:hypothetical protein
MVEPVRQSPLTAFPPREYEAVLNALLDQGYTDVSLSELKSDQRHMFLRHDIDLCPKRALAIAQREAALGVSATYYFLISTSLYSIAAAENRNILEQIIGLGHEIGLHFDAEQYSDQADALDTFAEHECRILELCAQHPVRSISFHRADRWQTALLRTGFLQRDRLYF